jgi:hypothetical protein
VEPSQQLLQEISSLSPTCRRGEGFADKIDVSDDTIKGRAVPYGVTVDLAPGLREEFRPGAFTRQAKDPSRAKICYQHGNVIGRIVELDEREDGLYFVAQLSKSQHNPEALRARDDIAEGLMDELSVGFNTVRDGTSVTREEDGSTLAVHHRAKLMEISLVPWGVYARGAVLQRSQLVDHQAEILETRRAEARAWAAAWATVR